MRHESRTPRPPFSADERRRSVGMVLGAAVGDALGAPFEFGMPGEYRRRFPRPLTDGEDEMVGGGGFGWEPGEFTDDTQMAMALAESFLEEGAYDADAVWRWFRAWVRTARDVGVTTGAALRVPDWRAVPRSSGRGAGNGALMRAFPLAAALLDEEPDVVREVVVSHGLLTHPDPGAGWGAWLGVEMYRTAIRGADPFGAIGSLLEEMPVDQREDYAPLLDGAWHPDMPHPPNGSVWGCLAEAVWAVRSTTSFEAAVVEAVDLGGDTDTVACVAGALAGALHGVDSIPERWIAKVHGRIDTPHGARRYSAADLEQLTLRLLGALGKGHGSASGQ